jgi:catechol 2,3-dioxygenase-like lactoylglutathione lyase family enzyme
LLAATRLFANRRPHHPYDEPKRENVTDSLHPVWYILGEEVCAMKVTRMDHIGVNVEDFAAAKAFFLDLGLELQGEGGLEGGLLDRVTGFDDAKTSLAFFRVPDGQTSIELVKFHRPTDERGVQQSAANTLGIRHLSFVVDDIAAMVAKLKEKGFAPFSELQRHEDIYKLCYIHGPEGIIVELAEELK